MSSERNLKNAFIYAVMLSLPDKNASNMRLPAPLRKFVADSEDEVYFLVRLLIFTVNVIAWIFSICFICVAIWILQEKSSLGVDNLSSDPAVVLLVIGSILFLITFTGCVGTLRENLFLLKLVSNMACYGLI